jgi:hypothetical protein
MKKLKIMNWANCIQNRSKWKLYFEKSKTLKIEVVAPKEEDIRGRVFLIYNMYFVPTQRLTVTLRRINPFVDKVVDSST